MATQSKSVSQLKSEVLQISSRPYELTEYNSDKIITGEINPGLINSNIATYEKNSEGTIIIDKNKDLSNQKMLISLNTTKISNTKFNQIIDTEFQDFILKADTSLLFLESKLAALQALDQQNRTSKKVNTDKIKQLQEQIVLLENQIIEMRKLGNNLPDSISYGTTLQYVKNSNVTGLGSMLLSKGRKAKARFDANGSFKVTLGNYDKNGQLIDGTEKVSYTPVYAGNLGTKNLTDEEASNYLINNPDITTYMYSYTNESNAKFAEIQTYGYNGLPSLVAALNIEFAAAETTLSEASLANINAYLDLSVPDYNWTTASPTVNSRRALLTYNAGGQAYTKNGVTIPAANVAANIFSLKDNLNVLKQIDIIKFRQGSYLLAANTVTNKTYWTNFYASASLGVTERIAITNTGQDFTTDIIALRKFIAEEIRNFKPINTAYNIPVPGGTRSIPINQLITAADRELLGKQNILGWSATKNMIEVAKKHWRYVIDSKPSELSFRSYLSDAQAQSYLNNYGDLQDFYGSNNLQGAKQHWNYNGFNEGRTFSSGNSILHIWRSDSDKKGYIEIVKGQPWHVRWTSEYSDLSKSSRIFLDDNGILYLYDKAKIVWQSFNE